MDSEAADGVLGVKPTSDEILAEPAGDRLDALLELADYNTVRARAGEPDLTVRKMWLVPAGEEE